MILRFAILIFAVFLSQACSTSNSIAKEESKPVETTTSTGTAKDIQVGENFSNLVAKINVQDSAGKTKSFKSYINGKDTVIAFVKPGCVFCESFEAVLDSTKPKFRPSLIIVMDSSHATLKDVNESKKKHPNIKANWLFDHENKFKDVLGVQAFPKFAYVTKDGKLAELQNGLVVPENQEALKTLPFAEILQKLSINTVNWLVGL